MFKQTQRMTQGSPLRLIFFFSLPLMIGNVCQQLYTAVDSIIVGQGVGVQALASLGAADWIYWLVLWSIHGFTQGFSVLVSQTFGSENQSRLRQCVAASIVLCAVFACVLTAAALVALNPMLALLHTPSSVMDGSQRYLRILFGANVVVIAYNMAAGILRALGNSRLPLIAMVISSVCNVALDLLFVIQFQWGITGAAAATILAQLFAFLICLRGLHRIPLLRLSLADWKIDWNLYRNLCGLGIPLGLQNSVIAVGGMIVQTVLNGFGVSFIAAFTASNKLNGVMESIASSFGYGLSTYMGQNHGAGKPERLDRGVHAVLLLSLIFSAGIAVMMIVFGHSILRLFLSSSDPDAGTVLSIAYHYLFILCCSLPLLFLVHVYRNALQGLGNVTGPVLSGIAELSMRAGVALLLPRLIGQNGIFYCETAAWLGASVTLIVTYYATIDRIKQQSPLAPS